MAKKSAKFECPECSEKFSISCREPELVVCCPFCNATLAVPYDDIEVERNYDDDDDEGEDGYSIDD